MHAWRDRSPDISHFLDNRTQVLYDSLLVFCVSSEQAPMQMVHSNLTRFPPDLPVNYGKPARFEPHFLRVTSVQLLGILALARLFHLSSFVLSAPAPRIQYTYPRPTTGYQS